MTEVLDVTLTASRAETAIRPLAYRPFGAFRLLLASLVVLQHFNANAAPLPLHDLALGLSPGSSAVLVFFALSGFVIAEAVERFYRRKPFAFIANRLLRIMPHFVLAVMLSVALHYAFFSLNTLRDAWEQVFGPEFHTAFAPVALIANFVAFLPIPVRRWAPFDFLSIAWAVRIEMAFYLAVFGTLLAAGRFRFFARNFLAVMGAGAAVIFAAALFGLAPAKAGLVAYFAFGYALHAAISGRRAAGWFGLACLPAMLLNFLQHPIYTDMAGTKFNYTFDAVLTAGLLIAMIVLSRMNPSRLRLLDQALGEITFPLYLYHIPVMIFVLSVTQGYSMPAYLSGIALSFAVSYAMSRLIDPVVAGWRDRLRGRTLAAALG